MTGNHTLRPLRCRINQLSHLRAVQYEAALRDSLLAAILAARESGATFAQLCELLDGLETAPATTG
jgi:hypothetical protein